MIQRVVNFMSIYLGKIVLLLVVLFCFLNLKKVARLPNYLTFKRISIIYYILSLFFIVLPFVELSDVDLTGFINGLSMLSFAITLFSLGLTISKLGDKSDGNLSQKVDDTKKEIVNLKESIDYLTMNLEESKKIIPRKRRHKE